MTDWPSAAKALTGIGYGLVVVAVVFALIWHFALPLWLSLGLSAFLLVRLNRSKQLPRDQRTALADVVMLSPLLIRLLWWR
jgi:hypothetical protein